MDTRFWGPSGWRFLHLITVSDAPQRAGKKVHDFFELIAYVLPCKFCRSSYSEYIAKDPVPAAGSDTETWAKWLWRIHNCVNEKLRSQNLPTAPDPPFDTVFQIYRERLDAGCTKTEFNGWEFLFSIAENHPLSRSGKNSQPMPEAPTIGGRPGQPRRFTDSEKNRWNLLTPKERMKYYRRFWILLPSVLPYKEWERAWIASKAKRGLALAIQSRPLFLKWLWRRRCSMEDQLELLNRESFDLLCNRLANARSGCGLKKRAKTCRRIVSGGKRKTRRDRRR